MLYAVQLGINNSYHRKIAKGVCMYTTSPKFQLHHGEITLLTITRHFLCVQLALVCPPKNSARMSHIDGTRFQSQTLSFRRKPKV